MALIAFDSNLREGDVADRFLDHPNEESFTELFKIFTPQLVAFFRRRGHELVLAEDLAQEVMLTVYRKAKQLRDRTLFRAWLFRIARNAACRHFARLTREAPTVALEDVGDRFAAQNLKAPDGPSFEFRDWMAFLDPKERDVMTLRFVEEWEYHEIAAAKAIPIGTVQWRVFNSKKKLAARLNRRQDFARKAA
jgi:RNA polymerase sigma-70 factor (ECF subfamily)